MKLGFAGPRTAMPDDPRREVVAEFMQNAGIEVFHHGDCVGWDAYAHKVALDLGVPIVVHPPEDHRWRAYCTGPKGQVLILPPKPYLVRTGDIVIASFNFLAVPGTAQEVLRSGTWSAIRRAKAAGMTEENGRLVILKP